MKHLGEVEPRIPRHTRCWHNSSIFRVALGRQSEASCARDLIRYVLCATGRTENIVQFYYCWFCGTQPPSRPPVPRDPKAPLLRIDVGKLEDRRAVVFAAMGERPGQTRNSMIANKLDTLLRARSRGRRGWETATDNDVLDLGLFPRSARQWYYVGARSTLPRRESSRRRHLPVGWWLRQAVYGPLYR